MRNLREQMDMLNNQNNIRVQKITPEGVMAGSMPDVDKPEYQEARKEFFKDVAKGAVTAPLTGAADFIEMGAAIPPTVNPAINAMQQGFEEASKYVNREAVEQIIKDVTGIELKGTAGELLGEVVGIPGGPALVSGIGSLVSKYSDDVLRNLDNITNEARELFRTASGGDGTDSMAPAVAGDARLSNTIKQPESYLVDTSITKSDDASDGSGILDFGAAKKDQELKGALGDIQTGMSKIMEEFKEAFDILAKRGDTDKLIPGQKILSMGNRLGERKPLTVEGYSVTKQPDSAIKRYKETHKDLIDKGIVPAEPTTIKHKGKNYRLMVHLKDADGKVERHFADMVTHNPTLFTQLKAVEKSAKQANPLEIGTSPATEGGALLANYTADTAKDLTEKAKNATVGLNKELMNKSVDKGKQVAVRLNLNSSIPDAPKGLDKLQTLHDKKPSGSALSYVPFATVENVDFFVNQTGRRNIASKIKGLDVKEATGKFPAMSVNGQYNPTRNVLDEMDDDVVEIGFNPANSHLFVDMATGQAVKGAKVATVIGNRVYAKGVTYMKKTEAPEPKPASDGTPLDSEVRYKFKKGGAVSMKRQMELFEQVQDAFDEGGLMQEGGTVDPESGNEVPVGSTQEEVRDDIPAQLSEGEFVFPADVVRYIGLEKLMQMRQEAKRGLEMMNKMGQMGNADEATVPDDIPFNLSDLDMEDDGAVELSQGGAIQAQQGTFVQQGSNIGGFQPSQFAGYQSQFTPYQPPAFQPTTVQPIQQAVPTFQTGTAPSFTGLTGIAQPELGGADEMRTYVNDAGMTMQIPFKNGSPIIPIPEGYKFQDPEKIKVEDTKVTPTQVQTTSVRQVDEGEGKDGGSSAQPYGGFDNSLDSSTYSKAVAQLSGYQLGSLSVTGGVLTGGALNNKAVAMNQARNMAMSSLGITEKSGNIPVVDLDAIGKTMQEAERIMDDEPTVDPSTAAKRASEKIKEARRKQMLDSRKKTEARLQQAQNVQSEKAKIREEKAKEIAQREASIKATQERIAREQGGGSDNRSDEQKSADDYTASAVAEAVSTGDYSRGFKKGGLVKQMKQSGLASKK